MCIVVYFCLWGLLLVSYRFHLYVECMFIIYISYFQYQGLLYRYGMKFAYFYIFFLHFQLSFDVISHDISEYLTVK